MSYGTAPRSDYGRALAGRTIRVRGLGVAAPSLLGDDMKVNAEARLRRQWGYFGGGAAAGALLGHYAAEKPTAIRVVAGAAGGLITGFVIAALVGDAYLLPGAVS